MGLGVLATLLTTLVLHLYHKGAMHVPDWLEKVHNRFLLLITCQKPCTCPKKKARVRVREGFRAEADLPPKPDEAESVPEEVGDRVTYQDLAVTLDRFFLLLYSVTMVLTTTAFLIRIGSGV